jgi:hypothetical protein
LAWQHEYKELLGGDPVYGAKADYWSSRDISQRSNATLLQEDSPLSQTATDAASAVPTFLAKQRRP